MNNDNFITLAISSDSLVVLDNNRNYIHTLIEGKDNSKIVTFVLPIKLAILFTHTLYDFLDNKKSYTLFDNDNRKIIFNPNPK